MLLRKGEPQEVTMKVIDTKIVAVLEKADGSTEVHETKNVVTNAGDVFYAQRATGTTPTDFWTSGAFDGRMFLSQTATAASKTQNYSTKIGRAHV